jgi:hypothetical protein
MPTFTIHYPDGHTEHVDAERLEQDPVHLVLRGTTYVMNQPRDIVIRRLRRFDVNRVDGPAQLPTSG